MSWLFSSESSSQPQSQEQQYNTRSSRQPLLPPLGTVTERPRSPIPTQVGTQAPVSPYGPLRASGIGRGACPPSTPQIVGQQFFFPQNLIEQLSRPVIFPSNCKFQSLRPTFIFSSSLVYHLRTFKICTVLFN